jgi:alpha-mannosidase
MQFAICPVSGPAIETGTTLPTIWEDLFLPPRAVWLRQASPLEMAPIECTLSGEGIVFSALKPAERGEGVVLRCYNARPMAASGSCRLSVPLASAERTRADERDPVDVPVERDRRTVHFRAEGHEIVTLILRPALPPANERD